MSTLCEETDMRQLCGFFKRTRYYRTMPKYHAVKIRKEERYFITEGFTKKSQTNWNTFSFPLSPTNSPTPTTHPPMGLDCF
uniref:Uncharacterized protein n=1 Tax=Callorhinchus milii TaxID=7868 RepID=A0A4W3HVM7_CALMI